MKYKLCRNGQHEKTKHENTTTIRQNSYSNIEISNELNMFR